MSINLLELPYPALQNIFSSLNFKTYKILRLVSSIMRGLLKIYVKKLYDDTDYVIINVKNWNRLISELPNLRTTQDIWIKDIKDINILLFPKFLKNIAMFIDEAVII